MKKQLFIIASVLLSSIAIGQVKGNKQIETKRFSVQGLTDLEMGLYAKVVIDQNGTEEMTITADSNLLSLIDTEVVDGTLKLAQTEWIQPSTDILIKIGMPNLKRVQLGVHETLVINNLTNENTNLTALIGEIMVDGKVKAIGIGGENGTIDASKLVADEVFLNIWGRGKAIINAIDLLDSKLSTDARLELVNQPKRVKGNTKKAIAKANPKNNLNVKYINLKIRNNSSNRNQFVVVGPKPDGNTFSYGFPMMPGATKKERWTTGTKVYKKNKIGRTLLVTITAENEDEVVKLFE